MELNKEEIQALIGILKVEIFETKDLLSSANGNDKKEFKEYIELVKGIYSKVEEENNKLALLGWFKLIK